MYSDNDSNACLLWLHLRCVTIGGGDSGNEFMATINLVLRLRNVTWNALRHRM